jgi:DNA-binding IclR family transcriptional regulator
MVTMATKKMTGTKPTAVKAVAAVASTKKAAGTGDASPRSSSGEMLRLVEELATFDRIGVTRLSRHLGIPVANAHRILRTLERTGYVEQLPDLKEYRLTLKLFEIGCQVANRTTMRDIAALEIDRLSQQSGTTTNVGVLIDDYVLYLGKVEVNDLLSLNLRPGSKVSVINSALGKAMLAAEQRPLSDIVGRGPFAPRTEYSITTLDALEAELADVRSRGYAVERQELTLGLWGVAAPIIGPRSEQNGAVSASTYGVEMTEREIERLGQLVVTCASRISRKIGGLSDLHSWDVTRSSYPRP